MLTFDVLLAQLSAIAAAGLISLLLPDTVSTTTIHSWALAVGALVLLRILRDERQLQLALVLLTLALMALVLRHPHPYRAPACLSLPCAFAWCRDAVTAREVIQRVCSAVGAIAAVALVWRNAPTWDLPPFFLAALLAIYLGLGVQKEEEAAEAWLALPRAIERATGVVLIRLMADPAADDNNDDEPRRAPPPQCRAGQTHPSPLPSSSGSYYHQARLLGGALLLP